MLETPLLPGIPSCPGNRATEKARPRVGSFPRPTLVKAGVTTRPFAYDTLRYRVGRPWRGRAAVGGLVALERAVPPRGILNQT